MVTFWRNVQKARFSWLEVVGILTVGNIIGVVLRTL